MFNPLSPVKRGAKKIAQYPMAVTYGAGVAVGATMVLSIQAAMPPGTLTLTREQAQFLLNNQDKVVVFWRAGRNMLVNVAT